MRILIFTASTGGGHKRAAQAMREHFEKQGDDIEVKVVDGLALSGKLFNTLVCGGYTLLAKRAPKFYGHIYNSSDKKSMLNDFCNNTNKSKGKYLLPIIEEFKPDAIISCHAFLTTMLGDLKVKEKIKAPVIALITDFDVHYTYIAEGIDHYIVTGKKMVAQCKREYKLPVSKIHSFGIPTFDRFSETPDVDELKDKLGLKKDVKTILFMAGSFGVNEVLDIYKDAAKHTQNCQFIVITGNNKSLYEKFKDAVDDRTTLLMFVNNVEDYMHCSDLIITKPGGLTISESLQCGLPMAIYSAFPGQEAKNAEFLTESGVAALLKKNPGETIAALINYDSKLRDMTRCCKELCCGNSSQQILDLIKEIA